MKKLLIFTATFISSFYAQAQDILTRRSGEETLVKVVELTPDQVKFKRFDNPDGPLISILNQEVAEIKFENGTVQKFAAPAPEPAKTAIFQPKAIRKHALAVNLLPLLASSFNFFYDNRLDSNPNLALSLGAGTWAGLGLFSNSSREVIITGAAKFYLQGSDFYLSPYLKYRHLKAFNHMDWHQAGGGGAIGARHVFKSGLLIDSFLGLGAYGLNQAARAGSEEQYYKPSPVDLRLGLCLGYAF